MQRILRQTPPTLIPSNSSSSSSSSNKRALNSSASSSTALVARKSHKKDHNKSKTENGSNNMTTTASSTSSSNSRLLLLGHPHHSNYHKKHIPKQHPSTTTRSTSTSGSSTCLSNNKAEPSSSMSRWERLGLCLFRTKRHTNNNNTNINHHHRNNQYAYTTSNQHHHGNTITSSTNHHHPTTVTYNNNKHRFYNHSSNIRNTWFTMADNNKSLRLGIAFCCAVMGTFLLVCSFGMFLLERSETAATRNHHGTYIRQRNPVLSSAVSSTITTVVDNNNLNFFMSLIADRMMSQQHQPHSPQRSLMQPPLSLSPHALVRLFPGSPLQQNDNFPLSMAQQQELNIRNADLLCDAFMGNQLAESYFLCEPSSSTSSSSSSLPPFQNNDNNSSLIQCRWNPTTKASFCEAHNLRIDPTKIQVSRGGEPLDQVRGRPEEEEFPTYLPGAFQINTGGTTTISSGSLSSSSSKKAVSSSSSSCQWNEQNMSQTKLPFHLYTIMNNIIHSHHGGQQQQLQLVRQQQQRIFSASDMDMALGNYLDTTTSSGTSTNGDGSFTECTSFEERPTLFLTRYEYANLYHTYTDWYSAYQAVLVAFLWSSSSSEGNGGATTTKTTRAITADDIHKALDRDLKIIFLDGHSASSMDPGWQLLFPNAEISHVSDLLRHSGDNDDENGPVSPTCFRRAIFVPPGYRAPISIEVLMDHTIRPLPFTYAGHCGDEGTPSRKWHAAFRGAMVTHSTDRLLSSPSPSTTTTSTTPLTKAGLQNQSEQGGSRTATSAGGKDHRNYQALPHRSLDSSHAQGDTIIMPNIVNRIKVLLLSRQNYLAHPRMEGKVSRRIDNEEELLSVMRQQERSTITITLSNNNHKHHEEEDDEEEENQEEEVEAVEYRYKIDARRVVLEEHDLAEQIAMIQQADIIAGMHGAGLTHILVARPGSLLLELKPPGYVSQSHFRYLAEIAGCLHKEHVLRTLEKSDAPYPVRLDDFAEFFQSGLHHYLTYHHHSSATAAATAAQ